MEENRILEMVDTLRASGKHSALRKALCDMNAVDTAQAINGLGTDDLLRVVRILPKDVSTGVFSYLGEDTQERLARAMPDSELEALVEDLSMDDAVDFLQAVPEDIEKRALARMEPEERKVINQFLAYPRFSAGSMMTAEFVELEDDMTVAEAVAFIRKTGAGKETIDTCYCVDYARRLTGSVRLKTLLFSDEKKLLSEVMDSGEKLIYLSTGDDRKKVIALARKYDLVCLPVVDEDRKIAGIITIDDIIDVIEKENTVDFEKLASLRPAEKKYLDTGVFSLVKNRILWLLLFMVAMFFTGLLVESFDGSLTAVVGLAAAIPMLMGVGGNASLQASILITRGLALGELKTKNWLKILFKEIRVALVCGIILAAVNLARMFFFSSAGAGVYLIVCAALICSVVISKLIGCLLPLLAKSLKINPAHISAPLLTTLADAGALAVYFALAKAFIR